MGKAVNMIRVPAPVGLLLVACLPLHIHRLAVAVTVLRHVVCVLTSTAGAANAGVPLSIIVKDYGWNAYFSTLIGACALALLLLSPMVNLRSYVQRKEQRAARKLKGI